MAMKRIFYIILFFTLFSSCQESLEDRCAREAKEYTEKKCPAQIDKNIVIDSMTFDRRTHTLHYFYTINGSVNYQNVVDNQNIYKLLLEQIKNATSIKAYKDAGYSFAYTYRSEEGKILFDALFTVDEYKKKLDIDK